MKTLIKNSSGGRKDMGRFSVEFEVANNNDLVLFEAGQKVGDEVRRVAVEGVVDPGATRLVLPASVVQQLGVPKVGRTRTADGRTGMRDVVDAVRVTLQGRSRVFDAIVEPKRQKALIGAIVSEVLDFSVDCTAQKLVPRDPHVIVSELD
jgi:predicted aspartyl protease